MWDNAKDQALARNRENQLTGNFWRTLIDGGAIAQRFHNTSASAWDIVEGVLSMGKNSDALLLQEELVEQQKHLSETEAGKTLYTRLQKPLDSKVPEEGEVIENGEIVGTQVNGDFTSKPPKAPKEALPIDTSSTPPPLEIPRRRPGPFDINAAKRDLSAPPLSALATARNIERLQDVEYPEGVRSPREDLNKDVKDGKFRYLNTARARFRFVHLPADTTATSSCSLWYSARRSLPTFHHWAPWVSNPWISHPLSWFVVVWDAIASHQVR